MPAPDRPDPLPAADPHTTAADRTVASVPDPAPADDAVNLFAATVVQPDAGPPSHLLSSDPSSAGREHAGRAVRRLDRLIDKSRAAGSTDLAEGYRLLDPIGTGAFGSVWRAENLLTGEHVAIKFFAAGDEHWGKLLDEVRRLQELEGSHGIVMVKQVHPGTDDVPPYYVMQLANGGSLADRLEEAKKNATTGARPGPLLPQAEAVRIFSRVVEAMAAVHRRGVHHCDLKPRNILLHRTDPNDPDEPLIADFGQAHLATDDTPALGTFFYMPPDQAASALANALPDTRWDVYALGAVLYEMLTGEPPRRDGSLIERLKDTEHLDTKLRVYREGVAAAPRPTAHRKLVDPMLARIVDRCLALDPQRRPQSAGHLLALLRQRAWWRQTRPILALGTAATVLFLAILSGLSWWVGNKAYEQTRGQLTREVRDSLARTAWYGGRAIEHHLHTHVEFVERAAGNLPDELRGKLTAAADRVTRSGNPDDVGDRRPFDDWVWRLQESVNRRWSDKAPRTVALLLAAGDPTDPAPGHGFTVSRTADGKTHPSKLFEEESKKLDVYRKDWSFRDYFTGKETVWEDDGKGRRHPVTTATHVSRTSQSRQDPRVWQAHVVTPIWSGPGRTGRVVALLSIGLKVREHLGEHVRPPRELAAQDAEEGRMTAAYLVNADDRWVWHPDAMAYMEREARDQSDGRAHRDPDSFRALFRELVAVNDPHADPADYLPWDRPPTGGEGGWATDYTDLLQTQLTGDRQPEMAHVLPVYPFAPSVYPDRRAVRWAFVVQVDREKALEPLAKLRYNMIVTGSIVILALAALAAGLWAWLIRVLRGREFVTHG